MSPPVSAGAQPVQAFAYHEIYDSQIDDVYSITPDLFSRHVWTMQRAAADAGQNLVVSFDDGHESNLIWAAPILNAHGISGRFFLPTEWISTRRGFLSWSDVRDLADRGHVIGSHTATHAFLPHCSDKSLHEELYGSRRTLEDRLGSGVTGISMPGGRWNKRVLLACAAAGYETVYTSEPGCYYPSEQVGELTTPAVIGRFAVRRRSSLRTIAAYAAGHSMALRSLRTMYQIRLGLKRAMGDRIYQGLWSRLFRDVAS